VAKVADFGTARSLAPTIAGRTVDNPIWLAPEIMENEEYTEKASRILVAKGGLRGQGPISLLPLPHSTGGCVLVWHHPLRDLLAQVPVRQKDAVPDRARCGGGKAPGSSD